MKEWRRTTSRTLDRRKKYVSIGDKERSYESQGDDGQQRRLQGCEKKEIGMDNKSERRAKNKTRKYRDR